MGLPLPHTPTLVVTPLEIATPFCRVTQCSYPRGSVAVLLLDDSWDVEVRRDEGEGEAGHSLTAEECQSRMPGVSLGRMHWGMAAAAHALPML